MAIYSVTTFDLAGLCISCRWRKFSISLSLVCCCYYCLASCSSISPGECSDLSWYALQTIHYCPLFISSFKIQVISRRLCTVNCVCVDCQTCFYLTCNDRGEFTTWSEKGWKASGWHCLIVCGFCFLGTRQHTNVAYLLLCYTLDLQPMSLMLKSSSNSYWFIFTSLVTPQCTSV